MLLISLSVFFPFIPSLIAGSDTQPLFMIIAILVTLIFTLWPKFLVVYNDRNITILLTIFLIVIIAFLSIFLNTIILNKPLIFSRFASFVQLLMALIFAYLGSMKYFSKYINGVFWVYLIFTIIYFLSDGLVETLLIKSRDSGTSSILALTGRGARTLSPEPSFFANQLFNLMLISLLLKERGLALIKANNKILWSILILCLLCTLSGYGFLIVFFISLVFYFRFFVASSLILLITLPLWISYLERYSQFRALRLIFRVLTENPTIVLQTDASIATRLSSFLNYFQSFGNNFLFGDGFSLLQTGGLISIISSIGLIGLLFLLMLVKNILTRISDVNLRALLVFWFLLNLLAGPIGIPSIGIIIGLILRPSNSLAHQSDE